jgi:acetyltransferase
MQEWLDELRLPRGNLVRFRHVRPDDQPLIAEAIRTSSPETLLHRFFSPIRGVPPETLRQMLTIDRAKEACIAGVEQASGRIICGARYVRLASPDTAEIALTVHDEFQRQGLGTFLLQLLAKLARAEGIRFFEADVMTSNMGMMKLLDRVGPARSKWHRGGDVYHVVFEVGGKLRS